MGELTIRERQDDGLERLPMEESPMGLVWVSDTYQQDLVLASVSGPTHYCYEKFKEEDTPRVCESGGAR